MLPNTSNTNKEIIEMLESCQDSGAVINKYKAAKAVKEYIKANNSKIMDLVSLLITNSIDFTEDDIESISAIVEYRLKNSNS